jgi:adenosylmethionine-8-amino-7-oxononanoate aminotransferase
LRKKLEALLDLPVVGDIRSQGLMAAVEIVRDKATKEMFPAEVQIARMVWEKALANGVITRVAGQNSIALCPPLIITREQIDELVGAVRRAIEEVTAELDGEWKLASGK